MNENFKWILAFPAIAAGIWATCKAAIEIHSYVLKLRESKIRAELDKPTLRVEAHTAPSGLQILLFLHLENHGTFPVEKLTGKIAILTNVHADDVFLKTPVRFEFAFVDKGSPKDTKNERLVTESGKDLLRRKDAWLIVVTRYSYEGKNIKRRKEQKCWKYEPSKHHFIDVECPPNASVIDWGEDEGNGTNL